MSRGEITPSGKDLLRIFNDESLPAVLQGTAFHALLYPFPHQHSLVADPEGRPSVSLMTMPESLDSPLAQLQPPRRSATLPSKLSPPKRPSSGSWSSDGILYYHPAAKIVHFSPRALAPVPSSTAPSDFDYPVDTIETLPWRSPTERTVALGPLRLENLHGLTTFLKCGNVVHAILRNSQCWCVDGESTFVLRVRPLTYYRIEIPNETEDDKRSVADLKSALPKILRYEVTPCPFKRGFTVELPEEFKRPRRKRAWRPKGNRESAPARFVDVSDSGQIKGDVPSDCSNGEVSDGSATDEGAFTPKGDDRPALETIPDGNEPPESVPLSEGTDVQRCSVTETQGFHTLLARFEHNPEPHDGDTSFSSSVESFHSANPPSPLLPPSSSHSDSTAPTSVESREHFQGESQLYGSPVQNVTASAVAHETPDEFPNDSHASIAREVSSGDSTAEHKPKALLGHPPDAKASTTEPGSTATSTKSEISLSVEFRRRTKASREREYSPMPPPSILWQPNTDPSEKHSPASIIQKTCTLVLVPPVQLLVVLIYVAARIVIGPALHSALFNENENGRRVDEAVDDFDLPLVADAYNDTSEPHEQAKPDLSDLD